MADDLPPSQERVVAEYRRCLAYVEQNYHFFREAEEKAASTNDSIRQLNAMAAGRRTRSRGEVRLSPYTELAIALQVEEAASRHTAGSSRQTQFAAAALEVGKRAKPMRGRPADHILEYHVHALMALVGQHGYPAYAARYENSVYAPHMTSTGGSLIETIMRRLDPQVSTTALVNIVIAAQRAGTIGDKRFQHFFPFYGGGVDPETGLPVPGPGFHVESFQQVPPIYCP